MTKVYFARSILEYREEMAEAVRQLRQQKFIVGVPIHRSGEPPLRHRDLLPPPLIETLCFEFYEGEVDDQVMLVTSEHFGIASVHVVIKDENGNVVENGEADLFDEDGGCWDYIATVSVPSGTTITVLAVATDCFGGVGTLSMRTTIP